MDKKPQERARQVPGKGIKNHFALYEGTTVEDGIIFDKKGVKVMALYNLNMGAPA